jgi:hypothetical protein
MDYPDMPIHQNGSFDARGSLHGFLREFIVWEEKLMAEFHKPNGAVYRPYVRKRYADTEEYREEENDIGSFSTFEKAREKITDWQENYPRAFDAGIRKEYIDDDYFIDVRVNAGGEIFACHKIIPELDTKCPGYLDNIFIHIPVPFEKGDLVEYDGKPCVLTYLPHWGTGKLAYEDFVSGKHGDGGDMHANVYFFGDNGGICYDHVPFDELKFWHGELKGQNRFLEYFGTFIRRYKDVHEHELAGLISAYRRLTAVAADSVDTDLYEKIWGEI